ncbi:hypothetical protein Vch1786_I1436 [Vibrio cholerae O1 str. 2010EL-1786]|uniref:Uncharacterized protein n=2 Tax=Vibrio cholerae TaxID=666 RepID=Q9KQQ5_VIBCH|nr:hypothetical protein VC_1943 [Vibrio cholerae O1 biovar El Tor str. N16961]ACP06173.1 conserved hypothetical protein [Vibrio cholerae M66-2]ACP10051.1 conserved hypothetical protein [Vibrio cholerae O395]ACQ60585.1 hypothetical protein VCD_002419 [Vibrio cholerae MJ-1236]AET27036.1 hypothetical protein Vch1786_I1436 [Vibrio cholerae O1 str. 2010EL-1786]EEO08603.1 hypothetical protein VCC_002966 [Vibrio cholerae RC9]EEO20388.1 hypothetical protein VCF_003194 [Vibrio cholerae BX 330286]CSI3
MSSSTLKVSHSGYLHRGIHTHLVLTPCANT